MSEDVKDVGRRVRDLKNLAMDDRDDEQFEDAIHKLEEAERLLVEALREQAGARGGDPVSEFERDLAKQLVHIRGSLGGVWRRWAQAPQATTAEKRSAEVRAVQAYDSGYEVERADSLYGIVDSYTLVQRLVTRVFLDPAAVDDDRIVVQNLALRPELEKAVTSIREQIERGGRKLDEFAAADLTLVLILLGNDDWRTEMRRFRALKPAYALAATRQVVAELQELATTSPRASARLRRDLEDALTSLQ